MNLSFITIQQQLDQQQIRADFLTRIYDEKVRRCNLLTLRNRDESILHQYRELTSGTSTVTKSERQKIKEAYNTQQQMYESIRAEIRNNIWYFLSEIVEVPQDCYYLGGRPFFEIYPSVADPERPNAFRLAKWMSFYFFAVTQNIPAVISTFSQCDHELAIALHLTYEIIVKEIIPPRVTEENSFLFDGKRSWHWLQHLLFTNSEEGAQFFFLERLKYLVQRLLQATLDAWPFLHILDGRKFDVSRHIMNLAVTGELSEMVMKTISTDATILPMTQTGFAFFKSVQHRGRVLFQNKQLLPTFIMFANTVDEGFRVICNGVDYSIFNCVSTTDPSGEALIDALTSSKARPVIFTTNFLDYKAINEEKLQFIKKHVYLFSPPSKEIAWGSDFSPHLFGQFVTKKDLDKN